MKLFNLVVAMDARRGMGLKGQLPWHLPEDLKEFKRITTHVSVPGKMNAIVMGRKTWESIPEKFRPLPERINIVLTKQSDFVVPKDVYKVNDFTQAFKVLDDFPGKDSIESIFVIGGGDIFTQAVMMPQCQKLYITHIEKIFTCDVFFPPFSNAFVLKKASALFSSKELTYRFSEYIRK